MATKREQAGLSVAVTGPTGDLGIALVDALERSRRVRRIVGLARRPFDPGVRGWRKTEYRQGDVRDAQSVRDAVKGADVVVHLAFSILGGRDAQAINVDGSRRVFEAAVREGAQRICYASSVAAYGFHEDNPAWLDEDVRARGTDAHAYSRQKAEVEHVLDAVLESRPRTAAYVFRPCIVAGPKAQMLMEEIPYLRISDKLPDAARALLGSVPLLKPVIPDAGVRFQLVHEDDVASAFVAGTLGRGEPGAYNLAGNGTIVLSDLAKALGWYAVPVPTLAVDTTAQVVQRLPGSPDLLTWVEALRMPVLMKTDRARTKLGWKPKHTSRGTLTQMVKAYRAAAEA